LGNRPLGDVCNKKNPKKKETLGRSKREGYGGGGGGGGGGEDKKERFEKMNTQKQKKKKKTTPNSKRWNANRHSKGLRGVAFERGKLRWEEILSRDVAFMTWAKQLKRTSWHLSVIEGNGTIGRKPHSGILGEKKSPELGKLFKLISAV